MIALSRDGIFSSLQGEGKLAGVPSTFIRLQGCNLHCSFCDTDYAISGNGDKKDIKEILRIIESYGNKHIVITGGEPMLQQAELLELLQLLKDYHSACGQNIAPAAKNIITIETNGTIFDEEILKLCKLVSISPKLSTSSVRYDKNITKKIIRFVIENEIDYQLKFVICNDSEEQEILDFIADLDVKRDHILLMPEGVKNDENKAEMVIKMAMRNGFRFTPRLHILYNFK